VEAAGGDVACLRAENERLRADKRLLDELEAMPWAVEIRIDRSQPKCDSLPSLRSQIAYFLEQQPRPTAHEDVPAVR
jgi:hypothetical protein